MGDLISSEAGWAIWSKHQGTRDDYSVIDASTGPLSQAEFARVIAHFAPGNPPAESGTQASLPWVVLSRVGVTDKTYLGISHQVPTQHVDATGRPVSRTFYACVPYERFARDPVSYASLFEVVTSAARPADGALIPLKVPRLDAEYLASSVAKFGPEVVAATAALLLSGPVTITGPDLPGWQQRLEFLDAVAALLPYGYRTSYTAATWSDTGASAQRFRIVFASRAGEKSAAVPWRTARVPAGGLAARYHAYLARVANRAAGMASLATLIDYLSRQTQPCKFEQPDYAVTVISDFFQEADVAEGIRSGTSTPASVRQLFAQGRGHKLPPRERRMAIEQLIGAADGQDWPIIKAQTVAEGEDFARELLPIIEQTCRRLLWSAAPEKLVQDYLELLQPCGLSDELLASLLVPPEPGGEAGLDEATRLINKFAGPSPQSYPLTRDALARNPAAVAALLARLSTTRDNTGPSKAIAWLEPVLNGILPHFKVLVGDDPEPLGPDAIADINKGGGEVAVRYLLRAASYRECLELVLPGLAVWLAWEVVQHGRADHLRWHQLAMELTPRTVPEAAWLDLALLVTGNDPKSLFSATFNGSQVGHALAASWRELTEVRARDQRADELLTNALIGFLRRASWRTDQGRAAVVNELTDLLTADGQRPLLKAAVLDAAEALRQLPPDATAVQIAQACARACTGGLPARRAGEALARSGAVSSGAKAAHILEYLRRFLADDAIAAGRELPYGWLEDFAAMFANGAFGGQVADEFASRATRVAISQITHQLNLVTLAATRGTPADRFPVLNDAVADHLDLLRGAIDDLLRSARKGQGGFFGLKNRGRKDDGDGAG